MSQQLLNEALLLLLPYLNSSYLTVNLTAVKLLSCCVKKIKKKKTISYSAHNCVDFFPLRMASLVNVNVSVNVSARVSVNVNATVNFSWLKTAAKNGWTKRMLRLTRQRLNCTHTHTYTHAHTHEYMEIHPTKQLLSAMHSNLRTTVALSSAQK